MSKVTTAKEAAQLIKDNVTLGIATIGMTGWPDELAEAIQQRFLETGHPKNMFLVQACTVGDWKERSTNRWAIDGLLTKWMGAHIGSVPRIQKMIVENKIQAYNMPQGVMINLWREIAAGRPGLLTKVGLGTFVDPRIEGGKMNAVTTEEYVKLVEFEGDEYLFYRSFPLDVALIRGTTADEDGNLTVDKESIHVESLALAEATKNSGGIVIVQAEYLAKAKTLHPKSVKVPGILVDHVVIATRMESCYQTEGAYYQPSFSGDIRIPLESIPPVEMGERKIIARRAAMELEPGAILNFGIGMPSDVANVASEEGVSDQLMMTCESGSIGGVPSALPHFGSAYNVEAIMTHNDIFDYYDGGGLDMTFLGLAQVDAHGNVNVSKFSGRPVGCGGFVNITQNTKKVFFVGSFTAGGLRVAVQDGKLVIVEEGKHRKFLRDVEQITFSGKYSSGVDQEVLYITERAVFALENGVVTLREIAPGIDLEKDILSRMEFQPAISPDLTEMEPALFYDQWGGLKAIMNRKSSGLTLGKPHLSEKGLI